MNPKEAFIAKRRLGPTWQEIERRAKPWQQLDREHRYNPDTAIGPSSWTGATTAESSAPMSPAVTAPSDEEYARRAAEYWAKRRGTRFYDGFVP